jgi:hypothetical protein
MPAHTFASSQDDFEKDPSWKLKFTETSKHQFGDENSILSSATDITGSETYQEEGESFSSLSTSTSISFSNFDLPGPPPTNAEQFSSRKNQGAQRVRFAPLVETEYFEKVAAELRKDLWLSPLEMLLIKKDCIFTLWCLSDEHMLASVKGESASNRYCIRGLEGQTRNHLPRRAERKWQSQEAVFQEQWSQRDHHHEKEINGSSCHRRSTARVCDGWIVHIPCVLDQEAIAEKYLKASYDSKQEALLRGLKDEQAVRIIENVSRPLW